MASRLPRCRHCGNRITWFLSPFTGRPRAFEPNAVDPRTHQAPPAYPIEGRRAWRVPDLVEDLRARRETTEDAARDEVYDLPWHIPHACLQGTATDSDDSAPVERTAPWTG